eukprot:TRINITY_DN15542_c1_g1_i1.p1 TRINITY_DN15542_c1_g1~~TRINITY_DN15542_c1_g1_i1.p1  ORF type:complete len:604 (-),score=103.09 TRINITY_DN15542_c1_g1_i1:92-1645(-)
MERMTISGWAMPSDGELFEDEEAVVLEPRQPKPPEVERSESKERSGEENRPEMLLLVAGLLRRKREGLLKQGDGPEVVEQLQGVEEDLVRVERELAWISRRSKEPERAGTPRRQSPDTVWPDEHDAAKTQSSRQSPPSAGSTATPATAAPAALSPSPLPHVSQAPGTWRSHVAEGAEGEPETAGSHNSGADLQNDKHGAVEDLALPATTQLLVPPTPPATWISPETPVPGELQKSEVQEGCEYVGEECSKADPDKDSPKPTSHEIPKLSPAAESGDAVLMGSARVSAHGAPARAAAADPEKPCGKENVEPEIQEVVTPRRVLEKAAAKASPLQRAPILLASPSPPCARAASTPGRRAASSFGSTGLFRETPSPRASKHQRESPSPSPAPGLVQPRSLLFSPPPRYGGGSQLTVSPPPRMQVPGDSRPSAVPAWPFAGNSPVKCLPGVTVARSPSAPCLGQGAAKSGKHSKPCGSGGGTPRNLLDFRKSLEMALQKDGKGVHRMRQKQRKAAPPAPWR